MYMSQFADLRFVVSQGAENKNFFSILIIHLQAEVKQ